jgi:putative ABC transport system permease protein
MTRLWQDVRYGTRSLLRNRDFAAAVAVLAIGVGINTAVFSLVNAVLFRPLTFRPGAPRARIRSSC